MIIFKQAVKRILQNKVRLVILMIMPVLFILMFALQAEKSISVGIVDKDNTFLSKKLADNIKSIYEVNIKMLDDKAVYDKTVSRQVDYTVIIEPGFEKNIISGKKPDVGEFYLVEKEKLFYAKMNIENYISDLLMLAVGTGNDRDKFTNAVKEYENGKLTLTNRSAANKDMQQPRAAMGFLIQFMIYMSVITAGLVLEDKSSGVFYRVFYAPVKLKRYFIENMMAFLMVGVSQVTLILLLVRYVLGLKLGSSPISLFILMAVFSVVCISLGIMLVSMFSKPIHSYIAIVLLATPLVMLGGCYWPKSFMPDVLNKVAQFLPTSWVMDGVDKIIYNGKNIMDILLEILVLIIFAGIFMAAGLIRKVDISK